MGWLIFMILVFWLIIGQDKFSMIKFQKIKIFCTILLITSCWLVTTASVSAATLYFNTSDDGLVVGDIFTIEVWLDTENEDVNAIDVDLDFSLGLRCKDFSDGGSIVSLWMERPQLSEDNKISFSGLIPGGFRADGLLLKLTLEAKSEGLRIVSFGEDSGVLLNDGKGTVAELRIENYELRIQSEEIRSPREVESLYISDVDPPESFEPKVIQLDNVFEGKYFVIFSAQDKDSGIDYYEVFDGGEWIVAESPYVLKNQDFRKNIQVKVVDKSGNERIEKVSSEKSSFWYANYLVWFIMTGGLLYVLWKVLKVKFFA